ncbi:MarR family transcriptional regulator [bacterium]|nr:MAG: MarR family transcriptional regulator [bacterium]
MSTESPHKGPYLGAMLRLGWQLVREQIFSGVVAAGYNDLNPAHVGLFRYPTLDRQRPSELAEQLQITRQSVNDLLGHLEGRGYLTREPDPADGRARVVRLTAKGHSLEKAINDQAHAAELKIAELLGRGSFSQLRNALEELAKHSAVDRASLP